MIKRTFRPLLINLIHYYSNNSPSYSLTKLRNKNYDQLCEIAGTFVFNNQYYLDLYKVINEEMGEETSDATDEW